MKVRVYKAGPDDVHKGWIRVSDELDLRKGIPNGAYVQLIANNRKVYCQIRGTPEKAGRIEMNEWYRNILGWRDPPTEAELTIKEVGFFARIRALADHPDDIVRVAIALAMISVSLSLISFTLAARLTGIVFLITELVLALVALSTLCAGVVILLRKFPKPVDPDDSSEKH